MARFGDYFFPCILNILYICKIFEDGQVTDAIPKLGVSENSVPLNPMVYDHYPY